MASMRLMSTAADSKPINLEDLKTLVELLSEAFATLEAVNVLTGSSHTHNNKTVLDATDTAFTAVLKGNYDKAYTHSTSPHAPSDAKDNVIETVKVNGTALVPTSKAVDVTVPTKVSQIANDSGFQTSAEVLSAINAQIDAFAKKVTDNGTIDTIKEVIDYIAEHEGEATEMMSAITKLQTDVAGKAPASHKHSYNDLTDKPSIPTVDSQLDGNSANPVQNKVINSALAGKLNTTDVKDWAKAASKPTYNATEVGAIPTTAKGAASGVAELDANSKLPSTRLDFATTAEVTAMVTEVLGA